MKWEKSNQKIEGHLDLARYVACRLGGKSVDMAQHISRVTTSISEQIEFCLGVILDKLSTRCDASVGFISLSLLYGNEFEKIVMATLALFLDQALLEIMVASIIDPSEPLQLPSAHVLGALSPLIGSLKVYGFDLVAATRTRSKLHDENKNLRDLARKHGFRMEPLQSRNFIKDATIRLRITRISPKGTLQKVIAAAIDNGNEAAQVAQESKITHEKLEELLSASPDPQVSLNALLRSRGPQRELDLGSRFAYVGGYKKFSTCFETAKKFQFNSCTVVSRGQGSKFKLSYGSWKDISNGENHSEAGRIDVVVAPETVEEKLLEFSISSNAIINALIAPLRDVSAQREILLLAEILNPEDVARAANKTLEEILHEIHSRGTQPSPHIS